METSQERMQRILSKFEKKIMVKDPDGEEVEIVMSYPSVQNSDVFWDVTYLILDALPKDSAEKENVEKDTSKQIAMIQKVLPKITDFVIKGYEEREQRELTSIEKQFYSSLIFLNTDVVVGAFVEMSTRMLGKGDAEKQLKAAQSQKE
jgi:hypothetical protein